MCRSGPEELNSLSASSYTMQGVIREICERFELGELVSVNEAGGTRNVTYIVQTVCGGWVVRRRYSGYSDPERIAFDHGAASFLAGLDVPVLPSRTTFGGATFWHDDSGVWEVHALVEGRHLRDGDAQDCAALGESLARFHCAGASFGGRYDKLGRRGETDPEHLLESIEMARCGASDADGALDAYTQAILKAAGELSTEAYLSLPHTLVHGDVQPANIIVSDSRIRALLDLDWVAWRPRIYDLCFAILCCCAAHERPLADGAVWSISQTPDLHPEPIREFLAAYEHGCAPLDELEKTAAGPQLMLSWCHIRIDNSLKVPAHERRAFLKRGLHALDDVGAVRRLL